ncbi:hypothetical protein DSO57_1003945 [Entomophthora muscae]|uniref:Uncharacterized protein n=1 Tax=Entomophthora muscae TaxID=34485 RepID=A0ACC2RZK5_9FUNG|nr:hypothetical protein DSO57_1003945 [Entomophthora muscae]
MIYFQNYGNYCDICLGASKILQEGLKAIPSETGKILVHQQEANPDDTDEDYIALAVKEKECDRAIGPKITTMNYEIAQYNAFKTHNGDVQGCFINC